MLNEFSIEKKVQEQTKQSEKSKCNNIFFIFEEIPEKN